MEIERALKTIGDWISKETESRKYPKGELLELSESLQALKATIARQSATSDEVAEAIYQMNEALDTEYLESDGEWTCYNEFSTNAIHTAITALQAYQPWIPCTERMPTEDDADENGHILAYSEGLQRSTICLWYHIIGDNTTTHWRKNIEPPKGE